MNTIVNSQPLSTKIINTLLSFKPLASFAKHNARKMMMTRASKIGLDWQGNVNTLQNSCDWEEKLTEVTNSCVDYPAYYLNSFHAYEKGNLAWQPAWELETAAYTVHSTIYSSTPEVSGDSTLRQKYHEVLQGKIAVSPKKILDVGCGVGLSTFALADTFKDADMTGLDLSPYFLAVAKYQGQKQQRRINWLHQAGENTHLDGESLDLVSCFLVFHELPQEASRKIIEEAYRLVKPGGYFALMDMNPQSEVYQKMPRYVLTLLKSTEPFLDQYFSLDVVQTMTKIGFQHPEIIPISARHRVIITQK